MAKKVKYYPSKPLVIGVDLVRENPGGQAHGFTHAVLNTKWAKKRTVTLCGLSTEGMRKMGTPFNGWGTTLCDDCAEALAQ